MNARPYVAAATLCALALACFAAGCSKPTSPQARDLGRPALSPISPQDTTPVPPPPPPPPPPILPVAFLGSDTAYAGTTSVMRWAIGNESSATFRVDYTLTCALTWPGFPLTGDLDVPAGTTVPLAIPVSVPADAAPGMVGFQMAVTRPDGLPPTTAEGAIRVVSDEPPPPPPPPPPAPVTFLGSDSALAGGNVTLGWELLNESPAPFTMQWTLDVWYGWAGYPHSGSILVPGHGTARLSTTSAVPDTAGPGPRRATLTVTRAGGLGPASGDAWFHVFR